MKIISYNINGLNAFVNAGKMASLLKDFPADIYCLQETKMNKAEKIAAKLTECSEISSSHLDHRECYNTLKNGYAGVMTMYHKSLNIHATCEDQLSKLESFFDADAYKYIPGRILYLDLGDYYLVNVYVLNSGNKDELRKQFDKHFLSLIKKLQTVKPVVIVGDFNVCAAECDYWGKYQKAIDTAPGLMQFEIDGFWSLYKECCLVDAFRLLHGNERRYSWYSPMGSAVANGRGWRIDYCLVSEALKERVVSCEIFDKYQAPDHSPIMIELL